MTNSSLKIRAPRGKEVVGFLVRDSSGAVTPYAGSTATKTETEELRPMCSSPEEAEVLVSFLRGKKKEHFVTLLLDTRRRLIRMEVTSIGTLTTSLVHPREVFQPAVAHSAAAVIVAHNHPSGDPEPSPEDIDITRRLRQAGDILGIEVLDHIIVGDPRITSMRSRGFL